ncbi:exonuclease sbcCD subunit D, partial [bacterium]|nr:exonuclease sbcCD subunit D [bacterium]
RAFGNYYKYVALGHIHKPQQVAGQVPVYYSGSPIALSFSERKDQKRMLLIDTAKGFEPEHIALPSFRLLKRISGSLNQVRTALYDFVNTGELPALLELDVVEEQYDPEIIYALDRLVFEYKSNEAIVAKHRLTFKNQVVGTAALFNQNQQLEGLKPLEVFDKRLTAENLDAETAQLLRQAFAELLDELNENNYENQ